MNDLLPIALRFLNEGISVVPVADDGSKRPALSWQKYQAQLPTADEVLGWFNNDVQGIGVITGAVSGNLEMLELEGRAVAQKMQTTDKYRKQSFLDTHTEIAKAMGYE